MAPNRGSNLNFGLVLGAIVLLALGIFLTTGGRLGGTQKITGDADLPEVSSPAPPRAGGRDRDPGNVGLR